MSDVQGDGVGPPGLMPGRRGGTLPCALPHDAFDIYFPARGQTDACENITFPQLRLRMGNIRNI